MNKLKKYLFVFFFSFFAFYPLKASAVTNLVGNSGTMGYYINGSYGRAVQFSGNFPIELLTSYSGYYKYLYGVESTFDLSQEFSGTYVNNGAYVYMQLHRGGSQGVMDWTQSNINMRYVSNSHNGVEKQGNCSIHSANNQYITYKCQVEYTNNDYPTTIYMKIGETANFTYNVQPYIGRTMLTDDTSSLYLQAMYFNAYSTNNEEPGTGGGSSVDLTDTNDKIDDVKDSVDDVKDSIDDVKDTLTDPSAPSTSDIDDFIDDIPIIFPGSFSTLVLLPIYILQRLDSNINSDSCSALQIPFLYNNTLTFPCFKIEDYIDNENLMSFIEMVGWLVIFYNIAKLVITTINGWTSLYSGFESLYEPKHAESEYKPKHGGGN